MNVCLFRIALFVAMAPMLACLAGRPVGDASGGNGGAPALGSFAIASRPLGDLTLEPVECAAGDRQSFLGADLSAPGSPVVLRLVVDPLDGPAIRLYSAEAMFDKSVVFRRSDCRTFHFSLESTGWRINDHEDYRLTLELDCAKDGETVQGTASSSHCH